MVKSHRWHDSYTMRARREGFPARSVYKLEEIQKKFGIIKKGARVLDLGCAPGSWLLFASKLVGPEGFVLGVDLTTVLIELSSNVHFVNHDVLAWDKKTFAGEFLNKPFDVVLSDMAPSCTGQKFVDAQRSLRLCRSAMSISQYVLKPGGAFVCKIFQGSDFKDFSGQIKNLFARVAHVRPNSTRKASKEIYVVGLGKKKAIIDE